MAPRKAAAVAQTQFIYSFVARGTTVLAEYSGFAGNFSSIAMQCLETLPPQNNKFTFPHGEHTLNYLIENGFAYMCLCESKLPKTMTFGFLERVKEDFTKRYSQKAANAPVNSLTKEYGPKLKDHMTYVVDHPEEMDKFAKIKAQVSEVKGVMKSNIDKVLQRGEKMEIIAEKTDMLRDQASQFEKKTKEISKKYWYENMKIKLLVFGIVVVLGIVIWVSVCNGFTCSS